MQPVPDNQQIPINAGERPIVIYVINNNIGCFKKYQEFSATTAKICGSLQIALGVFSIIFEAVSMGTGSYFGIGVIGYAYFSPVFWFLSGSFAIAAGVSKNICTIVTSLVLNIIASVTALYFIPFSVITVLDSLYYGGVALNILILIVGVLEGPLAIISAVCSCRVLCCCRKSTNSESDNEHLAAQVQYLINAGTTQQGVAQAAPSTTVTCESNLLRDLSDVEKSGMQGITAPEYGISDAPPAYSFEGSAAVN